MNTAIFRDVTGSAPEKPILWPAVVIPKEDIAREADRLAALPRPANGRRRSLIVHPMARTDGLAPGVEVSLEVLKPGEETAVWRENATQVNFCIAGSSTSIVGGKRFDAHLHDVFNTPSMAPVCHRNDSRELQVRLTYSNAALLRHMNVHLVEEGVAMTSPGSQKPHDRPDHEMQGKSESFQLTEDGAHLMTYEKLINPDVAPASALHWPWQQVKERLDRLQVLGKNYVGRRLYLLYHPATGRTNGTTFNFFATMCVRPAGIVDRPHRHTAAAINYYFAGSGHSVVEGKRVDWKAGDLMLSAPGWAIHNHASHDDGPVYELTIQDSPLNIWMSSLLWQENLKQPLAVLGGESGFATNRDALVGAK
jgi:gentisate 1,2-dioxygenase